MEPQDYTAMDGLNLMALCIWREARGEGMLGKRGVAHVVQNRIDARSFFGHDIHSVILKPWQFSSFNPADPNHDKWPEEADPSWQDSQAAAKQAFSWQDPDLTNGSLYYYSPPLTAPPHAWGPVNVMLVCGNLTFCKPAPQMVTDPDIAT